MWLPLPPRWPWAHENVQELEQPLVCEDVEHCAGDWVQNWQAMDPVLNEDIDGFKQAAEVRPEKGEQCGRRHLYSSPRR